MDMLRPSAAAGGRLVEARAQRAALPIAARSRAETAPTKDVPSQRD